jgi:hypothetical protein
MKNTDDKKTAVEDQAFVFDSKHLLKMLGPRTVKGKPQEYNAKFEHFVLGIVLPMFVLVPGLGLAHWFLPIIAAASLLAGMAVLYSTYTRATKAMAENAQIKQGLLSDDSKQQTQALEQMQKKFNDKNGESKDYDTIVQAVFAKDAATMQALKHPLSAKDKNEIIALLEAESNGIARLKEPRHVFKGMMRAVLVVGFVVLSAYLGDLVGGITLLSGTGVGQALLAGVGVAVLGLAVGYLLDVLKFSAEKARKNNNTTTHALSQLTEVIDKNPPVFQDADQEQDFSKAVHKFVATKAKLDAKFLEIPPTPKSLKESGSLVKELEGIWENELRTKDNRLPPFERERIRHGYKDMLREKIRPFILSVAGYYVGLLFHGHFAGMLIGFSIIFASETKVFDTVIAKIANHFNIAFKKPQPDLDANFMAANAKDTGKMIEKTEEFKQEAEALSVKSKYAKTDALTEREVSLAAKVVSNLTTLSLKKDTIHEGYKHAFAGEMPTLNTLTAIKSSQLPMSCQPCISAPASARSASRTDLDVSPPSSPSRMTI